MKRLLHIMFQSPTRQWKRKQSHAFSVWIASKSKGHSHGITDLPANKQTNQRKRAWKVHKRHVTTCSTSFLKYTHVDVLPGHAGIQCDGLNRCWRTKHTTHLLDLRFGDLKCWGVRTSSGERGCRCTIARKECRSFVQRAIEKSLKRRDSHWLSWSSCKSNAGNFLTDLGKNTSYIDLKCILNWLELRKLNWTRNRWRNATERYTPTLQGLRPRGPYLISLPSDRWAFKSKRPPTVFAIKQMKHSVPADAHIQHSLLLSSVQPKKRHRDKCLDISDTMSNRTLWGLASAKWTAVDSGRTYPGGRTKTVLCPWKCILCH